MQLGEGMAATLLATRGANDTAAVAQALVGAFFAAGRTCGPPNALSSHSANETRAKYLTSTCYFIGPVIMAPMRNPAFQVGRQRMGTNAGCRANVLLTSRIPLSVCRALRRASAFLRSGTACRNGQMPITTCSCPRMLGVRAWNSASKQLHHIP